MTTGGHARPIVAPPWVFYSSPFVQKGYWLRTPLCTAQVDCPRKACGSKRWEPCKSVTLGKPLPAEKGMPRYEEIVGGYIGTVHHERSKAARQIDQSAVTIEVRGPNQGPPDSSVKGYTITIPIPPSVPE